MDTERLWMEVALRDLTAAGKDAITRNIDEIRAAAVEASKAADMKDGIANAQTFGKTLGDVAKTAAGVFTGIKLADVTKDMADFHKSVIANTAALAPLADRLNRTTDELQALQGAGRRANVTNDELTKTLFTFNKNVGEANQGNKAAIETFEKLGIKIRDQHGELRPMPDLLMETSRALMQVENGSMRASLGATLLGEKGARLTPLLRELSVPIADLIERGKSFGEIVDSDVVAKLDRAKNASEAAQQQFTALYATLAAPLHAKGLEYVAGLTADLTKRIREAKGETGGLLEQMDRLFGGRGYKPMGQGPAELNQGELAVLKEQLAARERDRARPDNAPRHNEVIDRDIADLKARIADKERLTQVLPQIDFEQDELSARRGGAIPAGATNVSPFRTGGASNPRPTGGGSNRDRIGEAVNQLRGEVEAAQAAYDALGAGSKTPLEDLEREVDLRKKIADELAKLGKYDPNDPRVAQIKDLVKAHEELETKTKQRREAMRDAVEIERRMGDGTAFLEAETRRLNEALDTGRLTYAAYSAAMKDASEKADDLSRKSRGAQEGLDGLMAGIEQGAAEWKRSNSSFETGKRLMNDGFNLLKQTGDEWASTGVVNVKKFEQAFLSMLLNIGLALAQSELMKLFGLSGGGSNGSTIMNLFGGGGSSGGGGFFSNLFGGGGGGTEAAWSGLDASWAFAEGGNYPAGVPRITGEKGWELDIPNHSGTILNQRQLASLLGQDGSGPEDRALASVEAAPVINIPITAMFGSVVSRAEYERDRAMLEQRVQKAAIAGVAEMRRTSSSYRKAFRG